MSQDALLIQMGPLSKRPKQVKAKCPPIRVSCLSLNKGIKLFVPHKGQVYPSIRASCLFLAQKGQVVCP